MALKKTLLGGVTPIAGTSAVVSALLVWLWVTSVQGKVYLTLAVLWCCDSDASLVKIILDHDPSLVAALACGVTVGCIVTAFWYILRPGESNASHIKYDILRNDR